MGKVIAIIQNKGGVGKTTIATNLAAGIAKKYPEKKVLMVDLDGQGNAAITFGIRNPDTDIKNTIYDCMVENLPLEKSIIPVSENLDLVAANDDMYYFEIDTLPYMGEAKETDFFMFFKRTLDPIRDRYDYIIVDSPPELKIVSTNILFAADDVYIPFIPETYMVQGFFRLIGRIQKLKRDFDLKVRIAGIIGMKMKEYTRLHSTVFIQADAYCLKHGIPVMKTRIPDSIKFPEFLNRTRMPVVWSDPNGEYGKYYFELVKEVLTE